MQEEDFIKLLRGLRALINVNVGETREYAQLRSINAEAREALSKGADYLTIGRMWIGEAMARSGAQIAEYSPDIITTWEQFFATIETLGGPKVNIHGIAEAAQKSE